jgi:hypothetical protein
MQHHITNITFIPRNVKTNYTRLKCNKVILIVLNNNDDNNNLRRLGLLPRTEF